MDTRSKENIDIHLAKHVVQIAITRRECISFTRHRSEIAALNTINFRYRLPREKNYRGQIYNPRPRDRTQCVSDDRAVNDPRCFLARNGQRACFPAAGVDARKC